MPKKFSFQHDWFSDSALQRRQRENSLQRIAKESQHQEEGQINNWLNLAKKLFDRDDDPDPQAA